jgi:hypothetical protein
MKILFLLILGLTIGTASFAQTETKYKKTSTVPQKVHNTFSKHKHYNGYKNKHAAKGHKTKHKHTTTKDIRKND